MIINVLTGKHNLLNTYNMFYDFTFNLRLLNWFVASTTVAKIIASFSKFYRSF